MPAEDHYRRGAALVPAAYTLDAAVPPARQVLTILVDTREQTPPPWPPGVVTESCGLPTGDYSTPLLSDIAAVERKSPSDFVGTLTHGRERWEAEVARARADLEWFAVVVEGSFDDCCAASRMHPKALMGSVSSLVAKGIPVSFAGSPAMAGFHIAGVLRRWESRLVECLPPVPLAARLRAAAQRLGLSQK